MSTWRKVGLATVFILALAPFVLPSYYIFLLSKALVMSIFAMGFTLLFGYTGLLSFGHAAYFALGAYTTAILIVKHGFNEFAIILPISIAIAVLYGLLVGYLTVRHTAIFFAVLTLAFSQVVYALIYKLYDITGGSDGIGGVRIPKMLGIDLSFGYSYYYFILAVFLASYLILWRVTSSPFGKTLEAIRENSVRAEFIGINVKKYRLASFLISSAFAGLAGALFAPLNGHVGPEIAYWTFSGDVVFMSILGGYRLLTGPVVGAMIYVFLKNFVTSVTLYWLIVLGSIIVIFTLALPQGVMGTIMRLLERGRRS